MINGVILGKNIFLIIWIFEIVLTADPVRELLLLADARLEPILDPGLELETLLSLTSLARSAFFSSNAYSLASFNPRSLLIFTKNFKHSIFSGKRL